MTSQINYSAINTSFPVAGRDNNSQGFRDNFTAIYDGLSQAASEISSLQQKSILASTLDTGDVVSNNLQGSSIKNGTYSQFSPIVYPTEFTSRGGTIDIDHAPVQIITIDANCTITISNWGANNTYSSIKLIIKGNASSVVITNSTTAVFHIATGFAGNLTGGTASVSYPLSGKTEVLDLWSTDSGENIYIKSSGQY